MTYLQLCQKMHLYSRLGDGLPGTLPTTVAGQTDRLAELVTWVADAWSDIQSARSEWGFLVQQGSFNTVAGTRTYALSSIANNAEWLPMQIGGVRAAKIQLTSTGVSSQGYIWYMPYEDFRGTFDLGSRGSGQPGFFTIHPDMTMEVDVTPDAIYTILIDYRAAPQQFTADSDNPFNWPTTAKGLPERHHEIIVWAALQNYCMSRGDTGPLYSMAQRKYDEVFNRLCIEFLPEVRW